MTSPDLSLQGAGLEWHPASFWKGAMGSTGGGHGPRWTLPKTTQCPHLHWRVQQRLPPWVPLVGTLLTNNVQGLSSGPWAGL